MEGILDPEMRDYYMGDNVLYLYSKLPPGTKMVLWAHNSHIAANPAAIVNGGLTPFGAYIHEAFGNAYYTISFAFNQGGFQAIYYEDGKSEGLKGNQVKPAVEHSLDWILAQTEKPLHFINLRTTFSKQVEDYLMNEVKTFNTGSSFNHAWRDYSFYREVMDYKKSFDAIIFMDKTTRARPTKLAKERMGIK